MVPHLNPPLYTKERSKLIGSLKGRWGRRSAYETKPLLRKEIEFYEANLDKFQAEHAERFLLIKGAKLIGHFATRSAAVAAGVNKFGSVPFLVRKTGEQTIVADVPALTLGLLQCPS